MVNHMFVLMCLCTCQQSVNSLQYSHVQLIQILSSRLLFSLLLHLPHCCVESRQELERGNQEVHGSVGRTDFFEDLLAEALIEAHLTQLGILLPILFLN